MMVFRIRGVPIRIGWSWLVIVGLVFWSLATVLFPTGYPDRPAWQYAAMAGVATVLLFASLLIHELSHTFRSIHEGVHVSDITLFLFGGVSQADEPIPGPGAEFRIVAAGPFASFVLMVFFGLTGLGAYAVGAPDPVVGVLAYLAQINGLLLVFNLVPALPLDGGRLLHAALWWRSGDNERATLRAAGAGRVFAVFLVSLGLALVLVGDTVGGIWFAAVGWFLLQAVSQEVFAARTTQALTGLRVADLMSTPPVVLDGMLTVQQLADGLDALPVHPTYPVVVGGRYRGTLVLARAGEVPDWHRPTLRLLDLVTPPDDVVVLGPDDRAVDAARRITTAMARTPRESTPVPAVVLGGESGQEPVGVVSARDLTGAAGPARVSLRR